MEMIIVNRKKKKKKMKIQWYEFLICDHSVVYLVCCDNN